MGGVPPTRDWHGVAPCWTYRQGVTPCQNRVARHVGRVTAMLLSDRVLRAEVASGRVSLEPFDAGLVQPSSVDVRLDRQFRTFENHRYPHIDPAEEQPDLTRLLEAAPGEPFILHPGEFA